MNPFPKVKEIKTKINKWDLSKLKRFCTAKDTINKTKRQHTECENIFANHKTDKGLIPNIYKQLRQLNIKKKKKTIKRKGRRMVYFFFKDKMQIANRHMKRCSGP